MARFEDHFSGHAEHYARHRPGYPDGLFEDLARRAPDRERAWDCGTGNGQVARGLAPLFREVVATDASAEQLARAEAHPGVRYVLARAEDSGLEARSVSLVACGASVHWFDLEAFYEEVRRVAKPGAVVAAWSYWCDPRVSPGVDEAVQEVVEAVDPDWPAAIHHPRDRYRSLPFPFREEPAPAVELKMLWTPGDLVGWLSTWSAIRPHRLRTGRDPLAGLEERLRGLWPAGAGQAVEVRLPLFMRVGRVD